jgi:hypothetical protein
MSDDDVQDLLLRRDYLAAVTRLLIRLQSLEKALRRIAYEGTGKAGDERFTNADLYEFDELRKWAKSVLEAQP